MTDNSQVEATTEQTQPTLLNPPKKLHFKKMEKIESIRKIPLDEMTDIQKKWYNEMAKELNELN
jgi:hypothetical protein